MILTLIQILQFKVQHKKHFHFRLTIGPLQLIEATKADIQSCSRSGIYAYWTGAFGALLSTSSE